MALVVSPERTIHIQPYPHFSCTFTTYLVFCRYFTAIWITWYFECAIAWWVTVLRFGGLLSSSGVRSDSWDWSFFSLLLSLISSLTRFLYTESEKSSVFLSSDDFMLALLVSQSSLLCSSWAITESGTLVDSSERNHPFPYFGCLSKHPPMICHGALLLNWS